MHPNPIVIPVRRWGYVLYGVLAAGGGGWLVKVAVANPGGFMVLDNAFAWIVAGLITLLLSGAAVAVDYFIHPPEIRVSMDGLLLVTPGRERFWQWSQIDQFRMMGAQARHVEFRWHSLAASELGKTRWQSLDFDVPLLAVQVRNMLMAAQEAAKAETDAAEFGKAIEAAKNSYPRLTPQQTVAVVMFLLVTPLIMVGLVLAVRH